MFWGQQSVLTQAAAESLCVPTQTERKLGEPQEDKSQGPQKKKQILLGIKEAERQGGEPRLLRAQRRDDADLATCQLQRTFEITNC